MAASRYAVSPEAHGEALNDRERAAAKVSARACLNADQAAPDLNGLAADLETALRANLDALLEHFIKTATVIEVKKAAGVEWTEADNDSVSALRQALQLRIAVGNLGPPVERSEGSKPA